tara:strand:+ start:224 stop:706 length:483 start_codon:yes stop_codon:yes gene_type:complete
MSGEEEDINDIDKAPDKNRKKIWLFIFFSFFFLLIGGGMSAFLITSSDVNSEKTTEQPSEPTVYHEFPPIVVDLKKIGKRTDYIKLKFVIEIVDRDLPLLQEQELEISDKVQSYLRSQARADVAGGKGTEYMRKGIGEIVQNIVGEARIKSVLFREIILQ